MKLRLVNILAFVSAIICVGFMALAIRSYYILDKWNWGSRTSGSETATVREYEILTANARLTVMAHYHRAPDSATLDQIFGYIPCSNGLVYSNRTSNGDSRWWDQFCFNWVGNSIDVPGYAVSHSMIGIPIWFLVLLLSILPAKMIFPHAVRSGVKLQIYFHKNAEYFLQIRRRLTYMICWLLPTLFCICMWIESYYTERGFLFREAHFNIYELKSINGGIYYHHYQQSLFMHPYEPGFRVISWPSAYEARYLTPETGGSYDGYELLGFSFQYSSWDNEHLIGMPFWFVVLLTAILNAWFWRRIARTKLNHAFPVEITQNINAISKCNRADGMEQDMKSIKAVVPKIVTPQD